MLKIRRKMHKTLPFMSDNLKDLIKKFPEIQSPINNTINEIIKTGEWLTVVSDIAYTSRNHFPKTVTIKYVCRTKSKLDKRTQSFNCAWKPE